MKESIDNLIIRFLGKEITREELSELENWLLQSSENKEKFRQMNEAYHISESGRLDKEINIGFAWEKMSQRISSLVPPEKIATVRKLKFWKIAASVAIIVSLGLTAILIARENKDELSNQNVEMISPGGEKSKILLPDGTEVWLNSDSKIIYNPHTPRKVRLTGEAFFDVAKNPNKPFVVETGSKLKIKVFGTRFNISAYPSDEIIEATLEEGKIAAEGIKNSGPVFLSPGQQLIFSKNSETTRLLNVDPELYSVWKENMLHFDNTPFGEVVKKIERWYDIQISLDPDLKQTERFTLTIKTESLRELLEMMSLTVNMKYEINGEKVFISKK